MIWAMVSSRSCFCWLYRASPSSAKKNIINLILVLTIWRCPYVESSVTLLVEGICSDQCVLGQNSVSLCTASFCISRPNLPVTPCISWLPTFAFSIPYKEKGGFPGGSGVKNTPEIQEPQETQVWSLVREDPLEEAMATHSSILACKTP